MPTDDLVWYAAFGSNLSRERFDVYLSGGAPPRSTNRTPQSGARDSTPPRASWSGRVPGELYFGAASDRWGGRGVAFFDSSTKHETLMRAYLISIGQFQDVCRQENRADAVAPIDLDELRGAGSLDLYGSRYGRLVLVDTHDDGRPMVTITSASRQEPNPPDASYLLTIRDGLSEAFDLTTDDIALYLGACTGIAGTSDAAHLVRQLREN